MSAKCNLLNAFLIEIKSMRYLETTSRTWMSMVMKMSNALIKL